MPTKDNGNQAICKAITYSNDGQVFVDFGDANPNNVNSLVQNHLLRVAATRAKARTLRDLTNIGMTCLEELGGDEEIEASEQTNKTQKSSNAKTKQKTKQQSTKSKSEQSESAKQEKQSEQAVKQTEQNKQSKQTKEENTKAKNKDDNGEMNKPSSAQMNAIKNLASRRGLSESAMDELAKEKLNIPSFQEITSDHAAKFIKILQQSA